MTALPILIVSAALLMGGAVLAYLTGAAPVPSFVAADRARFLTAAPQRIIAQVDLFPIMSMPLSILLFDQAILGYLAGLEKLPTLLADALIGLGFGTMRALSIPTSTAPCLWCDQAERIEVAMTGAVEVPSHSGMTMASETLKPRKTKSRTGAREIPPPMSGSPDKMPAKAPVANRNTRIRSNDGSNCGAHVRRGQAHPQLTIVRHSIVRTTQNRI